MIITALDTGMRRGEMLALTFADIDWKAGLIRLRGETTKSGLTRHVPVPTARLKAVLEWLALDASGAKKPEEAFVFTNAVGERVHFNHATWQRTVLKAHGITPIWSARHKYKGLSVDSQAAYRKVNLHWHDLRHEYGSRLSERGVPLGQVRDLMGHASITTTERYDNQTLAALQAAAARLEAGRSFTIPSHQRSEAATAGPKIEPQGRRKRLKKKGSKGLAGRQGFEPR
jgi:integrase